MSTSKERLDGISVFDCSCSPTHCSWCTLFIHPSLLWAHVPLSFCTTFSSFGMASWSIHYHFLWGLTLASWFSAYFAKGTLVVFIIVKTCKLFLIVFLLGSTAVVLRLVHCCLWQLGHSHSSSSLSLLTVVELAVAQNSWRSIDPILCNYYSNTFSNFNWYGTLTGPLYPISRCWLSC